jgi:hypothetical protein
MATIEENAICTNKLTFMATAALVNIQEVAYVQGIIAKGY